MSAEIKNKDRFSLAPLEYQVIVDRLAGATQSEPGRMLARKLQPSTSRSEVLTRLDYTDDARRFFDRERSLPTFQGLQDIREQISRAGKGGILSPSELWRINSTIKSVRAARRVIREAEFEYPELTREAQRLGLFPEIEDALDHAIHPDGEVLDRASSDLQRIRTDLSRERERVEHTISNMIQSYAKKGYLREANFTMKNGRYVLPFRQDCQKNVKAIVQARSSAGATVFIEPYDLVERNNRLSELRSEEEAEIVRILVQLSALTGSREDEIRSTLDTAAFLDFVFACGRLSREWKGTRAEIEDTIQIKRARHPMIPHNEVVPVDISWPGDARALIISGPNAGGKTVALKTTGLFALINQSGLHIPAFEGSRLPIFGSIHADIGDMQSIEWNLSSFSAHVELIKRMFHSLGTEGHLPALVLLDEIGRSTDPQEGSALSLSIIEQLLELDTWIAVTTHLPAIKNLVLSDDSRVAGASVEFDIDKARPLYTIKVGTLGASYAIAIARRLGLDTEILKRADDLLQEKGNMLTIDLPSLEHRVHELETDVAMAEKAKDRARRELNEIIVMERMIVLAALEKATKVAHEAERKLEEARKTAKQLPHKLEVEEVSEDLKKMREYSEKLRHMADLISAPIALAKAGVGQDKPEHEQSAGELEEGKPVWVLSLRREGELIELGDKRATVVIAGKRLKVPIDQLKPLKEEEVEGKKVKFGSIPSHKSLPLFIDLHGLTVDEAIVKLDPYIDEAFYQGRERAHVIHGFGTGRLRRGIHEYLSKHRMVDKYELADANQGGGGVTIVTLKSDKNPAGE